MYPVIWCSIDSFLAALAIGLVGRQRVRSYGLIAGFAICDGISYALGRGIRVLPVSQVIAELNPLTISLSLAGIVALLMLLFARTKPSVLWSLPMLLGLDNLFYGVLDTSNGIVSLSFSSALVSGLLAYAGFVAARNVRSVLPRPVATATAIILVAISFTTVAGG
jgi:hypothetical protein